MSRITINIKDLFNLPTAVIYNPDSFKSSSQVSTDTRTIKKNAIFVALKGENFDGHSFVNEAIAKGASAIIINKVNLKNFNNVDITIITVENTTLAYGNLANIWRKKLKAKVIGLTGSNGKTTTKEMLAAIFERKHSVCKTLANNNNQIGVPLTLFNADEKDDFVILEMGSNHFGEIAYSAKIAQPDCALITNIGDGHLEFFKNRKGVAKEKESLFTETSKAGGKIFINNDDILLKSKTKLYKNKVTYGFNGSPDVKGTLLGFNKDSNPEIKIKFKAAEFKVTIQLPGLASAKNFLAASAVALNIGMKPKEIKEAAQDLKSIDKRMNIIRKKNFILINDTYNANPESMKTAFEFMKTLKTLRRVAILGDMFELGEQSVKAHKNLAEHLKRNKINEVFMVGNLMKNLNDELEGIKIVNKYFKKRKALIEFLTKQNFDNSVVLVKGSRGMKMEEFSKILEGKN
jgi:UDP-N-acetylmuramoyl-tripeptide--D-alanyl-D-alanine ligase